ncbi:response regulator [Imhoffiella purpurea]|uniref:Two component transcriptional regulator, winged helix family n=1 Tax=Imhoffiella purpurea TaxID=1249627 RepID=W9VEM7_9GAMM|nr:response regulator [Imhoffiella purpurea]EXJ14497.1 two component transcriptional regulator, winged helix family [Imhoffiella purpurea]
MLSRNRPRAYVLEDGHAVHADLWIVDGTDEQSMAALSQARARRPVPALIVSPRDTSGSEEGRIGRPIIASRLLNALDLLVTKDLAYFPELVIGESATDSANPGSERFLAAIDSAEHRSSYSALIVDDSPTIRKQIELSLKIHGIETATAETGEIAMALIGRRRFDLIFLDVVLPGDVDGYQICRAIKKDATHRDVPVIMLTSKSSAFDRVRGSLAGCDTYLTKPVENQKFNTVLRKYLQYDVASADS